MISSNASVKAIDVAKQKGSEGFLSKPLARDKVDAYIALYKALYKERHDPTDS